MFGGSCLSVRSIADCTSAAAWSMFRCRSNCSTIEVDPCVLVELIEVTAGMSVNCLISGVATVVDIESGAAPGSEAETEITGNSMSGSAATGSSK